MRYLFDYKIGTELLPTLHLKIKYYRTITIIVLESLPQNSVQCLKHT